MDTYKQEQNKKNYRKNNPFPVRFGDLKSKMQKEAFEKESTIHAIAVAIIREYYEKKAAL